MVPKREINRMGQILRMFLGRGHVYVKFYENPKGVGFFC